MTYADILLPLPLTGRFTYLLPERFVAQITVGNRVVVPFGTKKHYTGIVTRIHGEAPEEGIRMKEVLEVFDAEPVVLKHQLDLWKWIAEYYLCTEGDVMKAALPSGFSLEKDSLQEHYRPRTELRVRLSADFRGAEHEGVLSSVCDGLKRSPKQQELLMRYLDYAGYADGTCSDEVTRHDLLNQSGLSAAVLGALLSKGILEQYESEVSRLDSTELHTVSSSLLSQPQQAALDDIHEAWQQHDVCLLHGVTSGGKTEIYIHLIEETLSRGEQVLYLMPEIALTTQMQKRLRRVFGSRLGIWHSRFSEEERVEIWKKQLSDTPYDIILGVRSSVFLPFQKLGLVIVDEEHENTYKQQDPAPRYHARDVAIVLAAQCKARTLLGTATPAIESYFNASIGKYGLATLSERYQSVQMPVIEAVDIRELHRKRRMCGSFSPRLLTAMREALGRGEQVILFQNRRGYSPMVECHTCGWVPRCERCDVSLTYHRRTGLLACHYCGNTYRMPLTCPQCGERALTSVGFGTERIEEELHALMPEARTDRLDFDTTRAKTAYDRILTDFAHGDTDVLIGTQMISKGLDFARVSVVGIMNADTMLNFPDFRSYERAYQLMAQVAGRAGRRDRQGLVILQTRSIDLPVVSQVRGYDYQSMYNDQLEERGAFRYPPFCRLVFIYLRGRDEQRVDNASRRLRTRLETSFDYRVQGPEVPPVSRIQGMYIRKLMLKLEREFSPHTARVAIHSTFEAMDAAGELSGIIVHCDVDPL